MSSTSLNTADDRTYVGNGISRLPSPTPSEVDLLNTPSAKILSGFHRSKKPRPCKSSFHFLTVCHDLTATIGYYRVILILVIVVIILFAVFQNKIVHWLEPGAKKIKACVNQFMRFANVYQPTLLRLACPPVSLSQSRFSSLSRSRR